MQQSQPSPTATATVAAPPARANATPPPAGSAHSPSTVAAATPSAPGLGDRDRQCVKRSANDAAATDRGADSDNEDGATTHRGAVAAPKLRTPEEETILRPATPAHPSAPPRAGDPSGQPPAGSGPPQMATSPTSVTKVRRSCFSVFAFNLYFFYYFSVPSPVKI